jgi:DNA-binding HxlR family transcriptional regulator
MVKKKERLENLKDCPITAAIEAVGGKWKPHILTMLKDGTLRFGKLKSLIPTVSQKALTQQLKELEEAGIVKRQVFAEVPPRVEYSLTPYGQTLRPVLDALYDWGTAHVQRYPTGRVPVAEPAI